MLKSGRKTPSSPSPPKAKKLKNKYDSIASVKEFVEKDKNQRFLYESRGAKEAVVTFKTILNRKLSQKFAQLYEHGGYAPMFSIIFKDNGDGTISVDEYDRLARYVLPKTYKLSKFIEHLDNLYELAKRDIDKTTSPSPKTLEKEALLREKNYRSKRPPTAKRSSLKKKKKKESPLAPRQKTTRIKFFNSPEINFEKKPPVKRLPAHLIKDDESYDEDDE